MKKITTSGDAEIRKSSLFSELYDLPQSDAAETEMAVSPPAVRPRKRRGRSKGSKSGSSELDWNIRRPSGLLEALRELIDLTGPALAALPVERRLDAPRL